MLESIISFWSLYWISYFLLLTKRIEYILFSLVLNVEFALKLRIYRSSKSLICLKWIRKNFSTTLNTQFNYLKYPVTPFKEGFKFESTEGSSNSLNSVNGQRNLLTNTKKQRLIQNPFGIISLWILLLWGCVVFFFEKNLSSIGF